jgi:thermostable 8-oxoguanine DNA glycosylase
MSQTASVGAGRATVAIELPDAAEFVIPQIAWGAIDAFPTPAYWAFQVLARRITGNTIRCQLGNSFIEEVAACLLGGHGIPARVGLAAFEHIRSNGGLIGTPSADRLFELLSEPLLIGDRSVRYRFARQKAYFLSAVLARIAEDNPPTSCGTELRRWLIESPGIGYKTASWIARNWLGADDVAILDIHLLRAGNLTGFLADGLTVERDYLRLEEQFLRFSDALGVKASELDAVIWHEMMSSPSTVQDLLARRTQREAPRRHSLRFANVRRAHSH